MSATSTVLLVPAPALVIDPAGPLAAIEKPVNVRLGPLVHADGLQATADELLRIGAFIYRVASAAGVEEIWNDALQTWQPSTIDPSALDALAPLPLAFKAGDAQPWQGVLLAAGQKDRDGAPRFAPASNGVPHYRLRAVVRFRHGSGIDAGLSAASADLRLFSSADNQRFKIAFDTGSVNDCKTARIALRNADQVTTGFVELRAGGPELEIATCDADGNARANVVINADGDIELFPAAGRRVIVHGDLEAEHVRYLPAGGTVKQTLA